jgi:predicted nucleotidyltransferase
MDIDVLLNEIKIKNDDIINIYQFGSRVYGTNTEKSDWDFFIIVNDDFPTEKNGYIEIEAENIDANVYRISTYFEKLKNNELQALMCQFLPEEKIWMEKKKFSFEILYPRLKISVLKEASRHLHSLAPRFAKEKNFYQENKMKLQSIRDLLFGIQIVKFGKILDYSEANKFKEYEKIEILYDELCLEFSNLIEPKSIEEGNTMAIMKFIDEYGYQNLHKYYEIESSLHVKFEELIQFCYTKNTPEVKISKEACGVIIDVKKKQLVSYPLGRIFLHGLYHCDRIDWSSAFYSEFIEGQRLNFYSVKNVWYISTPGYCSIAYWEDFSGWILMDSTKKKLFNSFNHFWKHKGYKIFNQEFISFNLTFMFYSKDLHSDSIVKYDQDKLVLISIRDMESLKELEISEEIQFDKLSFTPCKSYGEVLKISYSLNPIQQKGFIINDKNFNRIKLISPQFSALKDLLDQKDPILPLFIEIISRKTDTTFLEHFPKLKENFDSSKVKFDNICKEIQTEFDGIKEIEKKDFIKKCSTSTYKVILQKMKSLEIFNVKDYLSSIPLHQFEKYFK